MLLTIFQIHSKVSHAGKKLILYRNHGHETRTTASLRIVIAAEAAFWRAPLVAAKPVDTIFFSEFVRRGMGLELRTKGHFG